MSSAVKHKKDRIEVRQFLSDTKGHKIAAVIDIDELKRLETVLDLIPSSEQWLYKNKKALASVRRGLKQAASGRVFKLNLDEL